MEHLDDVLCKLSHLDLSGQIEDIHPTAKGLGASSEVFKGYWSAGNKLVAVKKLRIFLTKEDRVVKKLAREAYIWSKLEHENVLPLLGFFIEGGDFPVLIAEWMARGTLRDYMPNLGRGMEVVEMARGIAAGLVYLHEKGIIHSDLKSLNILISETGTPLLADFGLSYVLAATMSKVFETTTASDKGTVRWMAIELLSLSNDSVATPSDKSDVWAFGMTVYEMLKRDVPYGYLKNDAQVALAISRGKLPVRPSPTEKAALPTSERKLWDICTSCWKKKPEMRPSMRDILSDIVALQEGKSRLIKRLKPDATLANAPLTTKNVEVSSQHTSMQRMRREDGPSISSGNLPCEFAIDPVSVPFVFKAHAILEEWGSGNAEPDPELVKHGYGWFVIFNPTMKRQLDVNLVYTFNHDSIVHGVRFSNDGKFLAIGCNRSTLIYDVQTGEKTCVLVDENSRSQGDMYIRNIYFSPDGEYLATCGDDNMIWIWEISKKRITRVFEGHEDVVYGLAFSHDGRFIASGSGDETARLWDMESGEHKLLNMDSEDLKADVYSVAISMDDQLLATASGDEIVRIWDIVTGNLIKQLRGHQHRVFDVAFTPDGRSLVSGGLDGFVKHWNITPLIHQAENFEVQLPVATADSMKPSICEGNSDVTDKAETANEKEDGERWSKCARNLKGHKDYVLCVAVSPDGQWFLSGSKDFSVQFWDSQNNEAHLRLLGHSNSVTSVDISSQGGYFATGGGDGQARIWQYSAYSS